MNSTLLLTGIGLRSGHFKSFLDKCPKVAWVEVHSENYFAEGGYARAVLKQVRKQYPVSLHGVGLSLGSTDELNWQHLRKLRNLIADIDPCLVSEHLAWVSIGGRYLHDLLPLPYTSEALQLIVSRIQQVQEFLQRQILIENIASYIQHEHAEWTEYDFLNEVATRSGCGVLLDINNIYVTTTNLKQNAQHYINALKPDLIQEYHLAGFSSITHECNEILIDSHNRAILPAVWDLFRYTLKQLGRKPTMIEWDNNLPTLETLCLEAERAENCMREKNDVTTKLTG